MKKARTPLYVPRLRPHLNLSFFLHAKKGSDPTIHEKGSDPAICSEAPTPPELVFFFYTLKRLGPRFAKKARTPLCEKGSDPAMRKRLRPHLSIRNPVGSVSTNSKTPPELVLFFVWLAKKAPTPP